MQHRSEPFLQMEVVNDEPLDPFYLAAVDSVEEAVVNAMIAAEDMGGTSHDRLLIQAIDHDKLREVLASYGRLSA
jgi:L-aminopeptidase/D-esterase-like protein